MTRIRSKYKGRCAACGKYHIAIGDTIESLPRGGWALASCPAIKYPESVQKQLLKQAQHKQARAMSKAHLNTGKVPDTSPSRCNNDELVAQQLASFAKRDEDLSWAGIEDFH